MNASAVPFDEEALIGLGALDAVRRVPPHLVGFRLPETTMPAEPISSTRWS